MAIECYDVECPHHGCHTGEEGPYCYDYEDNCPVLEDKDGT